MLLKHIFICTGMEICVTSTDRYQPAMLMAASQYLGNCRTQPSNNRMFLHRYNERDILMTNDKLLVNRLQRMHIYHSCVDTGL